MGENYSDVLQPFYIMFMTYINGKEAITPVKENKAAHLCQDCVGGLGFRRGSWAEAGPVDVLDSLAICEKEVYHVHTGPDHEKHTQEIS